ncbi:hypothetical protein BWI17_02340 [Betaproteobacteria bacterium GR16-43]|nr:hypothetical protein BWI17_02340 [Betaproteobacteria bacterium GR16-43]
MRHCAACIFPLLIVACAPMPHVVPDVVGKPASEVTRLVAASEAKLFPCSIASAKGASGASADLGTFLKSEVTLAPGTYRVTLSCSSGSHTFRPEVDVAARAGKSYRLTGYLIDDSITIFTMKMRVKVAEIP